MKVKLTNGTEASLELPPIDYATYILPKVEAGATDQQILNDMNSTEGTGAEEIRDKTLKNDTDTYDIIERAYDPDLIEGEEQASAFQDALTHHPDPKAADQYQKLLYPGWDYTKPRLREGLDDMIGMAGPNQVPVKSKTIKAALALGIWTRTEWEVANGINAEHPLTINFPDMLQSDIDASRAIYEDDTTKELISEAIRASNRAGIDAVDAGNRDPAAVLVLMNEAYNAVIQQGTP